MRKAIAIILSCVLAVSISMAIVKPAQAYPLDEFTWLPPHIMRGYYGDPYYSYIVAYEDGSTVNLLLPVWNDPAYGHTNGLNVSKVIINFYEIGLNKTLDHSASPHQIASGEYELFTVSFTADLTEFGDSTWDHEYRIFVEHVNATGGYEGYYYRYYYNHPQSYRFVVISNAQVDAMESMSQYSAYYNQYYYYSWQSVNAQQKVTQAILAYTIGNTYYQLGDYTSAATQYNQSITLWEEALAAEGAWRDTSDEASLNRTLSETTKNLKDADSSMILANAMASQSYGWILLGIGLVFVGLGVLLHAYKKPKAGT